MKMQSPRTDVQPQRTASRDRVLAILRADPGDVSVQELAARTGLHGNTIRFHLERLEDDGLVTRQARQSAGPGRPPLAYTAVPEPDSERDRRSYAHLATAFATLLSDSADDPAASAMAAGRAWGTRRAEGLVRIRDTAAGAAAPDDGASAPANGSAISANGSAAPADDAEALAELTGLLDEIGFAAAVRTPEDVPAAGEAPTDEAVLGDASAGVTSTGAGRRDGPVILQRRCPFLEVAQQHQEIVCSFHLGLMRGFLETRRARLDVATLLPFASPAGCEAHLAPA